MHSEGGGKEEEEMKKKGKPAWLGLGAVELQRHNLPRENAEVCQVCGPPPSGLGRGPCQSLHMKVSTHLDLGAH